MVKVVEDLSVDIQDVSTAVPVEKGLEASMWAPHNVAAREPDDVSPLASSVPVNVCSLLIGCQSISTILTHSRDVGHFIETLHGQG